MSFASCCVCIPGEKIRLFRTEISLWSDESSECDRITESLRLEKTSEIIESNRHPNPTTPTKPCPEVHFNFFSLLQLYPCDCTLFHK